MQPASSPSSSAPVQPGAILAGLGHASRLELCNLIALLDATSSLELLAGALNRGRRLFDKEIQDSGTRLRGTAAELAQSNIDDAGLRHRLWQELSRSLGVDMPLPLSTRRAREAVSALAFRAAERLSPTVQARRKSAAKADEVAPKPGGWGSWVPQGIRTAWNDPKSLIESSPLLSFPDVVASEFPDIVGGLLQSGELAKDPQIAAAFEGHEKAMAALVAAGGGWAAFAGLVGAAGFAPYIMAAQASAWLPFVSGPAAVSFLAVMVNPVTLLVGIAALGWVGLGRGSSAVRSQVAARVAVILAVRGLQAPAAGLAVFVNDMRRVGKLPNRSLAHLSSSERHVVEQRLARVETLIGGPLPFLQPYPPAPWTATAPRSRQGSEVGDAALVGGLTAADLLYHAAAINPDVLRAADFSRTAEIADPFTFAAHVGDFATRGAEIALRGYTAERVVMARLIEDGHHVQLAADSTMPGYDLLVDGAPVQVKCGEDLSLLREHFERYPDIPVIADADLAAHAAESGAEWAHMVGTVEGFDLGEVEALVKRTLEEAGEMAGPDVLGFALAVGLARGASQVWQGRIPLEDLPAWLVVDAASRGLLTFAGGKAGAAFGLIVIGPAGALILGPVIAAAALLGTSSMRELIERGLHSEWHQVVLADAARLHEALREPLERRVRLLRERRLASRARMIRIDLELRDWIDARAGDEAVAAAETMIDLGEKPSSVTEAITLGLEATRMAPADVAVIRAQQALHIGLYSKPSLVTGITEWSNWFKEGATGWATKQKTER